MHLDDHEAFQTIDSQHMITQINQLPDQLAEAWDLGQSFPLPEWQDIQAVLIAGMGGSAIGGSLVRAFAAPTGQVPICVHRNYGLPAWASGEETLFIASSHSGNTEETLSAFNAAGQAGCRVLAVTTGGELAARSEKSSATLWQFDHQGQPRAAVGYSFALLLAAIARLGLLPDPTPEVEHAVQAMRDQQAQLLPQIPIPQNPAKRLAGQLAGRYVSVFGAGVMEPVARRWKGQINELAKTWAQFEALPEADHNTLAGVDHPGESLLKITALFLRAQSNHPRNQLRVELTKKNLMLEGLNTDFVHARGESRLAQQWTALHMGDYVAYYLAMIYEVDPTPVRAIEALKEELNP